MKESRFIAQNKEKWLDSEKLLNADIKDPEQLNNLFTQVVDDLSYSRTYYRYRSVRVYLNQLAREYFSIIYGNKQERKNTFKLFWTDELPQLIIFSKKPLLISLVVFLLAALIGVFSSMNDPEFTTTILGADYIKMTKDNIAKGDPMGVYKDADQISMFFRIAFNNLEVAFFTYVCGIFMAVGTLAVLLSNGIMLGSFQYFFAQHDLLATSALSIWLHGTLEISCIVIAGGAGLVLGSGLLFPGTYSRFQSFQMSSIRSMKIMFGIAPIIVLAAVIESFLTRYSDAPDLVKLSLILLSAAFIIGYFVVYPWWKSKRGFQVPLKTIRLEPDELQGYKPENIHNNADVLQAVFAFYKRYFNKFMPWVAGVTFVMAAITYALPFLFPEQGISTRAGYYGLYWYLVNMFAMLSMAHPVNILVNTAGTTVILYAVTKHFQRDARPNAKRRFLFGQFMISFLIMGSLFGSIYYMEAWTGLVLPLVFLFVILIVVTVQIEKGNIFSGLGKAFRLIGSETGQIFGLQFILLLLICSFLLLATAPVLYLTLNYLKWNFAESDKWVQHAVNFIITFVKILAFNLVLPIVALSAGMLYFSIGEIASADHLKKTIAGVGARIVKRARR